MEAFSPPFCASPRCAFHRHPGSPPYTQYIAWGFYSTAAFGPVPRFRCTACGTTFSRQTFQIDYYAKRILGYQDVSQRLCSCESLSSIGRAVGASTDSISNRIARASRQALAFESELASTRHPGEDLAADGLESFCVSQYHPNNITVLVGSESQFVYAADHATMRRKGRMTESQKARRAALELGGRPDRAAVERSFSRVADESLRVLSDGRRPGLSLWTDEHRAYPRAIRGSPCLSALGDIGRIRHCTISSRAARTKENPLFPVNYLDRELRKDLHEHARETVCFGRSVNRQMERLSLYLWWHNFLKPHRARSGPESHAEVAGYDPGRIKEGLASIWTRRAWLSLTTLTEPMRDTWLRARPFPARRGRDYLPKYALA
jgi:hypothetical protein